MSKNLQLYYLSRFVLDENINAITNAKNIAAPIPPAVAFSPPVKTPKNPNDLAPSIAPFASVEPNPIIGTLAPAFANSLKYG